MNVKTKIKFAERKESKVIDNEHYRFKRLRAVEKFTIGIVYWKTWRHLVTKTRLSKNQRQFTKLYFYEIHTRYYLTVVKGGQYVTASRLIRNFFLSKTNENLRTVISALLPYNLTAFVHGIRSQIEINALLFKFIKDPEYHQSHFSLNEDRTRVKELKTTINVNTLVNGLDSTLIPYQNIYDSLSLLLHPNPSAIKFYAQAEGTPTKDNTGIFSPKIKHFFDETVCHTESTSDWFSDHVWMFLTCIEHFLILFDDLKNEFYLNDHERKQHTTFVMAEFMAQHQKEILCAVNDAARTGEDPQTAINEAVNRLLKAKSGE
jgi:hypothetical protein